MTKLQPGDRPAAVAGLLNFLCWGVDTSLVDTSVKPHTKANCSSVTKPRRPVPGATVLEPIHYFPRAIGFFNETTLLIQLDSMRWGERTCNGCSRY
jgi:hypothetical protein